MTDGKRLEAAELDTALAGVPAWHIAEGKLQRTFVFRDFVQAMGFMMSAALVAERMNHHPEWFNVYKRVRVDLITHSQAGLTELDFTLAQAMDRLAE